MLIIGLTGSIGMGKSTASARFKANGVSVFDADAKVHELYKGAAAATIETAFPGTTAGGEVDRQKLAAALIDDPDGFKRLESIVHPLVWAAERDFLHEEAARGAEMAVLEIPLLFETGGEARVDVVVVVSASADEQRRRVMQRPGMSDEKLAELLARQMPDEEKRRRGDFIVDTDGPIAASGAQIDKIIEALQGRRGSAYRQHWA